MANWKFIARDLMSLWLEEYPRILGDVWLNDDEQSFRTDEAFCRNKIQSYCSFQIPAQMPIVIDSGHRYDPYITPEGFFLVMPEKPTSMDDIYRNYLMQNRFFHLPGSRTADTPTAPETPTEAPPPSFQPVEDSRRWVLRVSDLQKILTTIPKLIAMDWLEPRQTLIHQQQTQIQSILERNSETSLDLFFGRGGAVRFIRVTESDPEPYITEEGLFYTLPDKPSTLSDVFASFRDGVATNPSTTQSPYYTFTS